MTDEPSRPADASSSQTSNPPSTDEPGGPSAGDPQDPPLGEQAKPSTEEHRVDQRDREERPTENPPRGSAEYYEERAKPSIKETVPYPTEGSTTYDIGTLLESNSIEGDVTIIFEGQEMDSFSDKVVKFIKNKTPDRIIAAFGFLIVVATVIILL